MKYILLLTRDTWQEAGTDEDRQRVYSQIQEWWGRHRSEGKLGEGYQLQPPDTATTVVLERGARPGHLWKVGGLLRR